MLSSITPLGERGRRQRWPVTVTAFIVGAVAGGAALGAVAGELGSVVFSSGWASPRARLAALAVVLAAAVLADLRPGPVPGPRRQVDERWLTAFRGWVYGLGFGVQLGIGVTTVISSAATYVALAAAFLLADPVRGAAVIGCFGILRGLTPLLAGRVRTPEALFAFHARFERWREPAERAAALATVAILAAAIVGAVA